VLEKGITYKTFYCYFRCTLSPGTLKNELTERQCNFLVNLMVDNNHSEVSYEQFLEFILPRTKKMTKGLVNKIRQTKLVLDRGKLAKCKYNAVCTLAKLFECEVQVMKQIQKLIAKYNVKQHGDRQLDLQVA
jgi:Ca2+-binding EF-hand superfamily protein